MLIHHHLVKYCGPVVHKVTHDSSWNSTSFGYALNTHLFNYALAKLLSLVEKLNSIKFRLTGKRDHLWRDSVEK